MKVTKEMVDRFLCWSLPKDFAPDCHISFKLPDPVLNPNPSWPVGTNLFTADQARAMLEHVLAAHPDRKPFPVAPMADALLALDRIATRVAESPDGYLECVNIARRVLREFPVDAYGEVMAQWREEVKTPHPAGQLQENDRG